MTASSHPAGLIEQSGQVYGLHVRGRLPAAFRPYLRSPVGPVSGRCRSLAVAYRTLRRLPAVAEIWADEPGPQAAERFALFREPAGVGLTVTGDDSALFRIGRETIEIEGRGEGAAVAHYFFSYALPLWLELGGVPVLHASAVSRGDRAVAFVGRTGIGKSTLCARLVRSGFSFVADDGLPLREGRNSEWRCSPGPPWLRLWPSALERLLGIPARELTRVRETLEKRILPCDEDALAADGGPGLKLAAVYVLDGGSPDGSEVTTARCTSREALVRLIEHSLAGAPAAALGLSASRLEKLARLATRTPVRCLRPPAGGDRWEIVRQAILGDLPAAGDPETPQP